MYKKLTNLSFVIGLFFTILAFILLGNVLINSTLSGNVTSYTGAVFLVFGLVMMAIKSEE